MAQDLTAEDLPPSLSVLSAALTGLGASSLTTVPLSSDELSMHRDGEVLFTYRGEPLRLGLVAKASFFKEAGVPSSYATRCPNHLLYDQLTHWRSVKPSFGEGSFVIGTEHTAVQFLRRGTAWLPLQDVLGAIQDTHPDVAILVNHLDLTNPRRLFITLVFPNLSVNLGDEEIEDRVYGGVSLEHAPTGDSALKMEGFLYRCLSETGIMSKVGRAKITRHIAGDAATWVPRVEAGVDSILATMPHQFKALEETTTSQAPSVPQLLSSLGQLSKLSPTLLRAAVEKMKDEVPVTLFDAINIISGLATEFPENLRLQRQAMQLAGLLLAHNHACTACGRLI